MRVKVDVKRDPETWTVEDAAEQFELLVASIQWRKTYGNPFGMLGTATRAMLATWELQGTTTAARKNKLRKLSVALREEWGEMRGMPILWRSLEHRGLLVIAAWAIQMLDAALNRDA